MKHDEFDEDFDFEKFQKAAGKGNAEAQEKLAERYLFELDDDDEPLDKKRGFILALKSAEKGLPKSLVLLGHCYENGIGTAKNDKKAFQCYRKAVILNYTEALYDLGKCYYTGTGTEQDYKKAFQYFEKSVQQDYYKAFAYLGVCYFLGNGVEENKEKAEELLKKGVEKEDINALRDPIIYAIEKGNVKLLKFLTEDFKNFNRRDKNRLLEQAVMSSPSLELVEYVLSLGFSINYKNKDGLTLLHFSTLNSPETVNYFISKGIDIESKDDNGLTPLAVAARQGSLDVVKFLIEKGADFKAVSDHGINIFHLAAGRNPNVDVVKFFIDKGFDLESRDSGGWTPLLWAAQFQSNTDVIQLLIDSGANTKAKSKDGENMWSLFSLNRNIDTTRFNYLLDDTSLLIWAGFYCIDPDDLEFWIDNDAKTDAHDTKDRNFAHYAAVNKNPAIFEWIESQEKYKWLLEEKDLKGHIPAYYKEHKDEF